MSEKSEKSVVGGEGQWRVGVGCIVLCALAVIGEEKNYCRIMPTLHKTCVKHIVLQYAALLKTTSPEVHQDCTTLEY